MEIGLYLFTNCCLFVFRYQSTLGRAKSEGFKKSIATSAVTGILIFVNFSTFALGFW